MSFLERNIAGLTEVFQQSLFSQDLVKKNGYLQHLDPRTKIICFIVFLFAINLSFSIPFILSVYGLLLILAYVSKIPLKYFIMRVWFFLPFFTGIIALPAMLNIFTPGVPRVQLVDIPSLSLYLALTDNGIRVASFLIARVAVSVSLAILLVFTTDWIKLMKAFERLHFPKTAIVITLMTYRYIFVLLQTANNFFLARKSRMVGKPSGAIHRLWLASTAGVLFGKTQRFSEGVYCAMKSRGYNNRVRILSDFSFTASDYLAFIGTLFIIALLSVIWR